jgi:hypothetical protein
MANADYLVCSNGSSVLRRAKSDVNEKTVELLENLLLENDLVYFILEPSKGNNIPPLWVK